MLVLRLPQRWKKPLKYSSLSWAHIPDTLSIFFHGIHNLISRTIRKTQQFHELQVCKISAFIQRRGFLIPSAQALQNSINFPVIVMNN